MKALIATLTVMMAIANVVCAQERGRQEIKIVTGGVPGGINFGIISEQIIGGTPVKGAPYSAQAVTETIQTLGDGNRIAQKSTAMLFRDALGRERREETVPGIGPFASAANARQVISISDPVAGVNYSLNSAERVATKFPAVPAATLAGGGGQFKTVVIKNGPASVHTVIAAPKVEQLGWKVIEGVQAEGTRTTTTIPAGEIGNDRPIEIVDEQWRSPDLQVIVYSRHSDPRYGETVYSLANISRADPSANLFQVPPDYSVRDPRAGLDEAKEKLGEIRQRLERKLPQ